MLSVTCKIAIKAAVFLASRKHERCSINDISKHLAASEHTVAKMLQTLVHKGIINSVKGPNGGFYMTSGQADLSLMEIVSAIDGDGVFMKCGLGLSKCSASRPCPIHNEYKKARDILQALFINRTVSDLCGPVSNGLAYLYG